MELTSYKLDLVGVQEVQKGHYKSRRLHFLSGKGNENHQLGTGFVGTTAVVIPIWRRAKQVIRATDYYFSR